eukprot:5839155-Pyramimonas_sp.AAC.1
MRRSPTRGGAASWLHERLAEQPLQVRGPPNNYLETCVDRLAGENSRWDRASAQNLKSRVEAV